MFREDMQMASDYRRPQWYECSEKTCGWQVTTEDHSGMSVQKRHVDGK